MPDSPAPRSRAESIYLSLRRHAMALLTERVPFKAGALFFALVLWLVVSAEEPAQEVVRVRFDPLIDSSLTVISPPPELRAIVIGRARDLIRLLSNPPVIRRLVRSDISDTVTIQIGPEDVDLPPGVDAIVSDVQPRQLTLAFARTMQRWLPVTSQLDVSADSGFRVTGNPRFNPESVLVSGDRRVVRSMRGIPTVRALLVVPDSALTRVPLDTARLGVMATPAIVDVHVPVARAPVLPPAAVKDSGIAAASPARTPGSSPP